MLSNIEVDYQIKEKELLKEQEFLKEFAVKKDSMSKYEIIYKENNVRKAI